MSRAPRAVPSRLRRKRVFKQAKGFYGRRKNTITSANAAVDRSLQHAYIGRKLKKRNFRALWIQRINAAVPRARADLQPIYQRAREGRASRSTAKCCRSRHARARGLQGPGGSGDAAQAQFRVVSPVASCQALAIRPNGPCFDADFCMRGFRHDAIIAKP